MNGVSATHQERIIDGACIHSTEAGAGATALLVHGMPTSAFLWRRLQALLASELRLVALDLLGFGRSDKPERRDLSLGTQADLVARYALALGMGPVTLVGHDWGAAVAQVVAARYPGVLAGLVLVSSHTDATWPPREYAGFHAEDIDRRTTVNDLVRFLRETLPACVAPTYRISDEALDGYLEPWTTPAGMGAFFRVARSGGAALLRSLAPHLACLTVPTVIVWGESDTVTPVEEGWRLVRAFPAATLEILPGAGHLLPEEAPEALAESIQTFYRRAGLVSSSSPSAEVATSLMRSS